MQLQSLSTKTLFAGLAAGAIMLVASCGAEKAAKSDLSPVDYVNPLVGSHSSFALSTGNTYPAIDPSDRTYGRRLGVYLRCK